MGVVYWVVLVVIDRLLRYMESKICKYLIDNEEKDDNEKQRCE